MLSNIYMLVINGCPVILLFTSCPVILLIYLIHHQTYISSVVE